MRAYHPLLASLLVACFLGSSRADVPLWNLRFGDADLQAARDLAVDSWGNTVVVGFFEGAVDFGGGPLVSVGSKDIFVVKLSANGTHLWSRRFGGNHVFGEDATAVAVDAWGNIVFSGDMFGVVDFGGGPLTAAGRDVFVVKLDPNGAHIWSQRFGDEMQQYGRSVALDLSGNVVLAGAFTGSVDFGGGPLAAAGTYLYDIFLVKFDAAGLHRWSRRFGDERYQDVASVAIDESLDVVLAGYFQSSVDFGGGPLVAPSPSFEPDAYVAKFEADGSHSWSHGFGDSYSQFATGVAVDAGGDVVLAGEFWGSIDLGEGPLASEGAFDIFVAKFDRNGALVWDRRFGGASYERGGDVAAGAFGDISIAGSFLGPVDFGGGLLTSAGNYDIYVAGYEADGEHRWSRNFGAAAATDQCSAVAAYPDGGMGAVGWFPVFVDFGIGALVCAGDNDAFAVRFGRASTDVASPGAEPIVVRRVWPNPSNAGFRIDYSIPVDRLVALRVVDVHGRCVRTLMREVALAGAHAVTWDGRDHRSQRVPAGVYFVDIGATVDDQAKMIVVP